MTIQIAKYIVQIDDADFDIVNSLTWSVDRKNLELRNKYYFRHSIYDKETRKRYDISLHRLIMGCTYNDGSIVDHVSGDTLDCRKSNLRICTVSENAMNKKISSDNTSGFKGVSWHKRAYKWVAKINVNGKRIHLGSFTCARRAYEAYCEASAKYHRDYGRIV